MITGDKSAEVAKTSRHFMRMCFDATGMMLYSWRKQQGAFVLRFFLSALGGLFSLVTLGLMMIAVVLGGCVLGVWPGPSQPCQFGAVYAADNQPHLSAEGKIIDEFARERRLFVPASDIPDLIKQAFISAEDKNFYTHKGYDTRGILSAAFEAVKSRGRNVRGASTITQQVMKNFLLSGDRRIERKIKEIILATRLEESLSKEKNPRALPQRDFSWSELLWCGRCCTDLFQQDFVGVGPARGRFPRLPAQGTVGFPSGSPQGPTSVAAQFRSQGDEGEWISERSRLSARSRAAASFGPER